jgi:hypothetical protein
MCRIGNGVNYNEGVSPGAKQYYDAVLALAADKYAPYVMVSLSDFEIRNRLGNAICRKHAKAALTIVKGTVFNQRLLECLDYLLVNIDADQSCVANADFKKLSAGHINWG